MASVDNGASLAIEGQDLTSPANGFNGIFATTSTKLDPYVASKVFLAKDDQNYKTIDNNSIYVSEVGAGIPSQLTYYVMRGRDVDCVGLTYRYWVVVGSADTTGSQYTGAKCGVSALQDIIIINKYLG